MSDQINELRWELAMVADELAFWKHQAIFCRAWCLSGCEEPTEDQLTAAQRQLERHRQNENAERYAHAEPERIIGS